LVTDDLPEEVAVLNMIRFPSRLISSSKKNLLLGYCQFVTGGFYFPDLIGAKQFILIVTGLGGYHIIKIILAIIPGNIKKHTNTSNDLMKKEVFAKVHPQFSTTQKHTHIVVAAII
jgi:hypothetical protein